MLRGVSNEGPQCTPNKPVVLTLNKLAQAGIKFYPKKFTIFIELKKDKLIQIFDGPNLTPRVFFRLQ